MRPGFRLIQASGITAGGQTGSHIQLQHNALVQCRGQHLHGFLSIDGFPFGIVVVIAGVQTLSFHGVVGLVQGFRHALLAIQAVHLAGMSQHDVASPEDFV